MTPQLAKLVNDKVMSEIGLISEKVREARDKSFDNDLTKKWEESLKEEIKSVKVYFL